MKGDKKKTMITGSMVTKIGFFIGIIACMGALIAISFGAVELSPIPFILICSSSIIIGLALGIHRKKINKTSNHTHTDNQQ